MDVPLEMHIEKKKTKKRKPFKLARSEERTQSKLIKWNKKERGWRNNLKIEEYEEGVVDSNIISVVRASVTPLRSSVWPGTAWWF